MLGRKRSALVFSLTPLYHHNGHGVVAVVAQGDQGSLASGSESGVERGGYLKGRDPVLPRQAKPTPKGHGDDRKARCLAKSFPRGKSRGVACRAGTFVRFSVGVGDLLRAEDALYEASGTRRPQHSRNAAEIDPQPDDHDVTSAVRRALRPRRPALPSRAPRPLFPLSRPRRSSRRRSPRP